MRVVILGAGGHAQVIADILWQMHDTDEEITPIAFLDDNPNLKGNRYLNIPVLGSINDLSSISHDAVIIGIGNNQIRRKLFDKLTRKGEQFIIARHPSAIIAPDVHVGLGSVVCANVVINTRAEIGRNVILNTACTIDHHNHISDHVHVAPGAHLGGDVVIGQGTLIGIGATVLPQTCIGVWCTVGGGAVVIQNLEDGVRAVGNPARIIS